MACAVLGFSWVGMVAVDEWFVRDAVSTEKITLLRALLSVGAACMVVVAGVGSVVFLVGKLVAVPNDDLDEEYEFDSAFPDSPNKPR